MVPVFSASQFETYRALGSHILSEIVEDPKTPTDEAERRDGQRAGRDQAVLREMPADSVS